MEGEELDVVDDCGETSWTGTCGDGCAEEAEEEEEELEEEEEAVEDVEDE